jgi:hypothetical protein
LENDDHVFFHGTAAENLQPILEGGFIISKMPLSVSFAKNSFGPCISCKEKVLWQGSKVDSVSGV